MDACLFPSWVREAAMMQSVHDVIDVIDVTRIRVNLRLYLKRFWKLISPSNTGVGV